MEQHKVTQCQYQDMNGCLKINSTNFFMIGNIGLEMKNTDSYWKLI